MLVNNYNTLRFALGLCILRRYFSVNQFRLSIQSLLRSPSMFSFLCWCSLSLRVRTWFIDGSCKFYPLFSATFDKEPLGRVPIMIQHALVFHSHFLFVTSLVDSRGPAAFRASFTTRKTLTYVDYSFFYLIASLPRPSLHDIVPQSIHLSFFPTS